MTIGDLEVQAGMSRANIRYYEQERLIFPERRANGYRDYSQADLETLLRIKLLRRLDFSLEEIRRLQRGEVDFAEAMERRGEELARENMALAEARELCREIGRTCASFQELPAGTYLEKLSKDDRSGIAQADRAEFHPWRRYFARVMDYSMASLLILVIQSIVLHIPVRDSTAYDILTGLLALGVVLLTEPLFLHFWGTTPGKWVWGIRVIHPDGTKLTLEESFCRTFRVLLVGEGLRLPVANLICPILSYQKYARGDALYWEGASIVRFRERGWITPALFLGELLLSSVFGMILIFSSYLPPNRGALTVEEFAENFNSRRELFDVELPEMNDQGVWVNENDGAYVVMGIPDLPAFSYECDGETLRAVSYTLELENQTDRFALPPDTAKAAYYSLAAAQEGTTPFNNLILLITTQGRWPEAKSFSKEWKNVSMTYTVETEGYNDYVGTNMGYYSPVEEENRLTITFRAEIAD